MTGSPFSLSNAAVSFSFRVGDSQMDRASWLRLIVSRPFPWNISGQSHESTSGLFMLGLLFYRKYKHLAGRHKVLSLGEGIYWAARSRKWSRKLRVACRG